MPSPLVALESLGAIARAGLRVSYYHRRRSLPALVATLRSTPRNRRSDPRLTLSLLERLLPVLPPYGAGRCVKRSLLLLDLWSRAGLEPTLHLGLRRAAGERGGHAWIETGEGALATYRPPDVAEAYRV